MEDKKSIYFHIPFCARRCSYCDFTTYAGMESWIPAYFEALKEETSRAAENTRVHTIFFGGGTPSMAPADTYSRLLQTVSTCFQVDDNAEISLEANPGTLKDRDLAEIYRAGINRISLGVQSVHENELLLLGRIHSHQDTLNAINAIRRSGIRNLNLDLIYGLPEQTIERWSASLDQALDLNPEHLSLYCLTIEEGTTLYESVRRRELEPLPEDASADMYELAMAKLASAGYRHYEISNWAKTGAGDEDLRCRHNLQYWENREYYGFGAGAHGYIHNMRVANNINIPGYIKSMKEGSTSGAARVESRQTPKAEQMQDEMMLGLRLLEDGVSAADFKTRYGIEMTEMFENQITTLLGNELVRWRNGVGSALVLTRRGTLLGNRVFMEFVGDA